MKQVDWSSPRSEKLRAGCRSSAVTATHVTCDAFSSSSVISRAFSVLCVYLTLGIILIQATFLPNFVSFAASLLSKLAEKTRI